MTAILYSRRARRLARVGFLFSLALGVAATWVRGAEKAELSAGDLLVATPEMGDPRFAEAVIYIVKHNEEGAIGLVINRPLAKGPVKDLLKGFGIESDEAARDVIIHYGGPVAANSLFVLHSDDIMLDDSTPVNDGIAVTADAQLIEAMAQGKGPRRSLIIFGYAGWAPGQLEDELNAGAWFVVPADKGLVFGADADKKWQQAMDRRKIPL
jgi:putative transcriptional regulator